MNFRNTAERNCMRRENEAKVKLRLIEWFWVIRSNINLIFCTRLLSRFWSIDPSKQEARLLQIVRCDA